MDVINIKERTDALLEVSSGMETCDIKGFREFLASAESEMMKIYDECNNDGAKLEVAKSNVERLAIRLEYLISCRNGMYKETVQMRSFAASLRNDVRLILLSANKTNCKEMLMKIMEYGRFAREFYLRSLRLDFEVTDKDSEIIKEITRFMKEEKVEVHNG